MDSQTQSNPNQTNLDFSGPQILAPGIPSLVNSPASDPLTHQAPLAVALHVDERDQQLRSQTMKLQLREDRTLKRASSPTPVCCPLALLVRTVLVSLLFFFYPTFLSLTCAVTSGSSSCEFVAVARWVSQNCASDATWRHDAQDCHVSWRSSCR